MNYCISDIHGHYDMFCRLLDKIKFGVRDTLYVLGDIIDKGTKSVRLAKFLFSMPNIICIAGNHEYDFLKSYKVMMRHTEDYDYVLDKLRTCFTDGSLLDWDTVDKFDVLPFYIETQNFIGVHSGIPVREKELLPVSQATVEQLVYDRRFKDADILPKNGKCVLYGHTPVRYLTGKDEIVFHPRIIDETHSKNLNDYCKVHLDTGVHLSGVLGCVCLDTCQCFYVVEHQYN